MSINRVTKEETKRLIEHALTSSPSMTSKKLAEILSTQESRISQGKYGEWRLEEGHAAILVENFGQPRSGSGCFIQAEKSESISSFIEGEPGRSSRQHYEAIISYLSSSKVQDKLIEKLRGAPSLLGAKLPILGKEDKEQLLYDFKRLLLSPTFEQWLKKVNEWVLKAQKERLHYQEFLGRSGGLKYDNTEILEQVPARKRGGEDYSEGSSILVYAKNEFSLCLEGVSTMSLLLIGNAINHFELASTRLELGLDITADFSPKYTKSSGILTIDYVITGTVVWEHEGAFKKPKIGEAASEKLAFKIPGEQLIFSPDLQELVGYNSIPQDWQLDCWTTFKVRLFINKNCDYTLTIELGAQKGMRTLPACHLGQRQAIIPKISGLKLFEQLIELRCWLDLEEIPELEIKANIAKAGGYIPGAIIL